MHIVYVCDEFPPAPHGGIGIFVARMAEYLSMDGNKITIIGAYNREYCWESSRFKVVCVKPQLDANEHLLLRFFFRFDYRKRKIEYWREKIVRRKIWSKLKQIHKSTPIDIIEYPSYAGPFYQTIKHTTSVIRLHGAEAFLNHKAIEDRNHYAIAEAESLHGVKNWIGPTQWAISEFEKTFGVKAERSEVIPNPVDCELFYPAAEEKKEMSVLFLGTMIEHKGDIKLAKAANYFLRKFSSVSLRYVGRHTPDRIRQVYEVLDNIFHDRVSIDSPRPASEIAELMRNCSILAVPSRGETFGNVYAEAMASGIPVVGGNNTGVREVVSNGVAGFLVDQESVNEIADAICKLLGDKDLRYRMGIQGRRIAEREYSLNAVAEKTLKFYRDCMSG